MRYISMSPEEYLEQLPPDHQEAIQKLRHTILNHLPPGFVETINYNTIGYVVPKSLYPAGYHCDPAQPLPFMNIAAQKNFVALYHMGLYADEVLLQWFIQEYHNQSKSKLDMGKSCIRFKKLQDIPFTLIGELVNKISAQRWIELYEQNFKRKRKSPM